MPPYVTMAERILADPRLYDDPKTMAEFTRLLPESDGKPVETIWHFQALTLLIQIVSYYLRDRKDIFVGGNTFMYYSPEQVRNEDFLGPDFFFVSSGVDRYRHRDFWAKWDENKRLPDVIIELTSPSTAKRDHTTKKAIYEKTFETSEYFCFDPIAKLLEGWRLDPHKNYRDIQADERGWMWSEKLQLWLGTWEGAYLDHRETWLRFYDKAGNLVLLESEAEKQRADEVCRFAEMERKRAEEALAETARLQAELAELRAKLTNPGQS